MRRTGFLVLVTLLLCSHCGRAPEALHLTVSKELKDALGPLMLKHQLGLYVLKATRTAPGTDRLAGHPLLTLCPPSAGDLDFEAAGAVLESGTSIFSGFESYLDSDSGRGGVTVGCPTVDKPCISISETRSKSGRATAVKISRNLFDKNTSTKEIVVYCTRRMRENQGVLLANRKAAASVSSQLLELVLD